MTMFAVITPCLVPREAVFRLASNPHYRLSVLFAYARAAPHPALRAVSPRSLLFRGQDSAQARGSGRRKLVGDHFEAHKRARAERSHNRDVGGVAPACPEVGRTHQTYHLRDNRRLLVRTRFCNTRRKSAATAVSFLPEMMPEIVVA